MNDGDVGSRKVFRLVQGGIKLVDPRFKLRGIGVSSMMHDEAAGLTLVNCWAHERPITRFPIRRIAATWPSK